MFKGEFKFDLKEALATQFQFTCPQYCKAYHTTNEPIEEWLKLTPVEKPRVLTVAASGDQPLMYAASGASHVDTFDVTIYACAVMDFKTAALKNLNFSQYLETVQTLSTLENLGNKIPKTVFDIIANMPQRTRTLMYNALMYRKNAFTQHTTRKLAFPKQESKYEKMQETAHKPFNFIWADLENVSHYIESEYDIINTSNIFDHYIWYKDSPDSIYKTILNLWPHLRRGGYIISTTTAPDTLPLLRMIPEALSDLRMDVSFPATQNESLFLPMVIQKTR